MTESVTGFTADRMLEMENASVISGSIVGNELMLQTKDGNQIDAGNVRGPKGDTGPPSLGINAWPIGSIFMAVVSTNPATLLGGGTWVAWGTGRVPVAVDTNQAEFDSAQKIGGEKTHILGLAEIPKHTHTINHDHGTVSTSSDSHSHQIAVRNDDAAVGPYTRISKVGGQPGSTGGALGYGATDGDTHSHTVNLPAFNGNSGNQPDTGGGAHNNLQPYITCYMWVRTA